MYTFAKSLGMTASDTFEPATPEPHSLGVAELDNSGLHKSELDSSEPDSSELSNSDLDSPELPDLLGNSDLNKPESGKSEQWLDWSPMKRSSQGK